MRAGRLRKRIVIQHFATTDDAWGGTVEKWLPVTDQDDPDFDAIALEEATVWAGIEPLRGREFWEAQQANSQVSGKVILRYREGISSNDRILTPDGRQLEIVSIIHPDERGAHLEILFKEVQS